MLDYFLIGLGLFVAFIMILYLKFRREEERERVRSKPLRDMLEDISRALGEDEEDK